MIGAAFVLVLLGPLPLPTLEAAARDSTIETFLESARAATARYHDVELARIDGYRPVGPDFPGMGEHWVNVSLLLDARFEITAPAILSYAPTAAGRRLVGVAYAVPLHPGERPPSGPIPARYWHEHSGSIDEESLVLHHVTRADGHAASHEAEGSGVRLAVAHAWIWLDNPAGVFATDNWALPWFRAGLEPMQDAPVTAARMLAFASGAEAYYLAAARALAWPTAAEEEALAALFAEHAGRVRRLAEAWSGAADSTTAAERAAALIAAWDAMWTDVAAAVAPEPHSRLAPLRGQQDP